MVVFGWIVLSFVIGYAGSKREIGFGLSCFCSLLLSPIVGLIIVFSSDKLSDIEFRKQIVEALKLQSMQKETTSQTSYNKPQVVDGNLVSEATNKVTAINALDEQVI